MAKDCLFTSLKGSANNDNLPIFDTLMIKVDTTGDLTGWNGNPGFSVGSNHIMKVWVNNGTFLVNGVAYSSYTTSDPTQSVTINFTSGVKTNLYISDYTAIKYLSFNNLSTRPASKVFEIDVDSLGYTSIDTLYGLGFAYRGKWHFENPQLVKQLQVKSGEYNNSFDDSVLGLSALADAVELQRIYKGNSIDNSDKNISVLGKCTKLVVLDLSYSNATGTLESLGAAQVANGRTSGQITVNISYNEITWDGMPDTRPTGNMYIKFSSGYQDGYIISDN